MKTPEEIKKGLGSCSADECHGDHTDCPYIDNVLCIRAICGDALAYIQQLEAKVAMLERVRATQATSVTTMQDALFKQQLHQSRLLEERSQLEAERDAAVRELVGTCQVCRWENTAKCSSCHFCEEVWDTSESNWEWRGVQKEE